jgi:hypothetical protein
MRVGEAVSFNVKCLGLDGAACNDRNSPNPSLLLAAKGVVVESCCSPYGEMRASVQCHFCPAYGARLHQRVNDGAAA